MPAKTREYLYSRFETSDRPTNFDFIDLIDSAWSISDDSPPTNSIWGAVTGDINEQMDLISLIETSGGLLNVYADKAPKLGGILDVTEFGLGDGTRSVLKFIADAGNQFSFQLDATAGAMTLSVVGGLTEDSQNLYLKGKGADSNASLLTPDGTIVGFGTAQGNNYVGQNTLCLGGNHLFGSRSAHFGEIWQSYVGLSSTDALPAADNGSSLLWVSDGSLFGNDGDLVLSRGEGVDMTHDVIAPKTPGFWRSVPTNGFELLITDNAGEGHGILGYSSSYGGPALARTVDGVYNPLDGGLALSAGFSVLTGSTTRIASLAGTEQRDVRCDTEGNLYAVLPPNAGWSETGTSATIAALGEGTGVGTWADTGAVITVPEDVTAGNRMDLFMSAYYVNLSDSQTGTVQFGFGEGTDPPTAGGEVDYVPEDFAGILNRMVSSTAGFTAGTVIRLWARRVSGTNKGGDTFDCEINGSIDETTLEASAPATAVVLAQVNAFNERALTYGSLVIEDNLVPVPIAGSSTDWSEAATVPFAATGPSHNIIADHVAGTLTVEADGVYAVRSEATVSVGNNKVASMALFVGATKASIRSTGTQSGGSGKMNLSVSAFIPMLAGESISLMVQNESAGTDVLMEDATVGLTRLE